MRLAEDEIGHLEEELQLAEDLELEFEERLQRELDGSVCGGSCVGKAGW